MGVNLVGFNSKNKETHREWKAWQDKPIPPELYEKWKSDNIFKNGVALIPGKVWRGPNKGKYLVFIDLDNLKGIDETYRIFRCASLKELGQIVIVEQHKDNLSKAHIYFYSNHIFIKKSSDAAKHRTQIEKNEIPAIEVKGLGSHGLACCSPSIHQDGQPYEIIGTKYPQTFGKEIEERLFEIYKQYGLNIDANGKIPMERLYDDDFIVYKGHNRHEASLRIIESYYQKYRHQKPFKEIQKWCYQWNQDHCNPPLDDIEFEKQWNDAIEFIDIKNREDPSKKINPDALISQLNTIDQSLIFKITDFTIPPKAYYIDNKLNQVCYGYINKDLSINPLKSIINIVPKKVIYYHNPIFPKMEPKTVLEFYDGSTNKEKNLKIGPCNNLNEIIKVLDSHGYTLYKNKAADAFNNIIVAMKEKGLTEYVDDVTTGGYYIINKKIISKETSQKQTPIIKEDVQECCKVLDQLAAEGWINKKIFPTVLKWGLLAPFSFAIKQINKDGFLPWLFLYGQSGSGKSTLGEIISKIWQIKDNDKGFSSIDSPARLGQTISQSTYPVLINEVGMLTPSNGFNRYTGIIEMMKSSVTSITARSKFYGYTDFVEIPALSPLILTSNHKILDDSGFIRRFVIVHFGEEEKKTENQQENFEKINLDILDILGDFIAQNITIDMLTGDWKVSAEGLLRKFYALAEVEELSTWIGLFEEQKGIEDEAVDKKSMELRAFFIHEISGRFSQHSRSFSSNVDPLITQDLVNALDFCLKNKLLSFLHYKKDEHEILITIDIMKGLQIANVASFKDLAPILGFEYTSARLPNKLKPMKVLKGTRKRLVEFLYLDLN